MMRSLIFHFIVGVLLIAVQQIFAAQIYDGVLLCDVIIVFLLLQIFFSQDTSWLFLSVFIIGAIQSVWSGRSLGFDALLYGIIAYFFYNVERIMPINFLTFSFMFIVMFVIKFLFYFIIGHIFNHVELYMFPVSFVFLQTLLVTFIVAVIGYGIFSLTESEK